MNLFHWHVIIAIAIFGSGFTVGCSLKKTLSDAEIAKMVAEKKKEEEIIENNDIPEDEDLDEENDEDDIGDEGELDVEPDEEEIEDDQPQEEMYLSDGGD